MRNIFKIAWRNLLRYKRRSLLTSSLIVIGVVLVIVFGGVGIEFKDQIISIITDSNLSHIQIHKKGYVGSIDNLPLDKTLSGKGLEKVRDILENRKEVTSYSERIRFSAMLSSYVETTSMRLTAVLPEKESLTCPDITGRIKKGNADPSSFVKPGSIVIPMNIASGMNLKVGDEVVLVANNRDGSVNGMSFNISGISENIMGPAGKDGYIHLDDAMSLLRIENGEVTEIAIRLNKFNPRTLKKVHSEINDTFESMKSEKTGKSPFEIHTWEELSPFASIARIVTFLILMVKIILASIVLISILNVMMMSVYERIGEIGTIAAIGTVPSKILYLFMTEALALGTVSGVVGSVIGILILFIIRIVGLNITFGSMNLVLSPQIPVSEVVFAIVMVIVISTLASLQPAIKASKMEPVDALRHV